ncbi:ABC transporter ATP-binding protein [Terracidiphilus sp.]|uniref:ABC transporter ATP-binding protein n=1 Tax=Terracidiphilus sp. TaxID=1964191 RepID=UPI003C1D42CB
MTTANVASATISDSCPRESALIAVENVTMRFPIPKRYREWVLAPFRRRRVGTALSNANLDVQTGDRIAVMGPNGAGKTTLLKLIAGVLLPTEGKVLVNGHSTLEQSAAARRSVGFVFNEERSFFWRLSGVQNLEFFGALDNLYGRQLRERIEYVLELVGLSDAGDKAVYTYSSGMKQRLAIARVLIAEPDLLILDEPTRALDPVACDQIVELILSTIHRNSRKTLLIATHRPDEASLLCNKVLVVGGGNILGRESIEGLNARGTTVLEYYRQLMVNGERS